VIEPKVNPDPGSTTFCLDFIEDSPELARLLTMKPYLDVLRAVHKNPELTLHRTAALYKRVGAIDEAWHTDWAPTGVLPRRNDHVLNNSGACSPWFYLNGTHPSRGGLAIIPESHRPDWPGPRGMEFTEHRKFFFRKSDPERKLVADKDFEESFSLFTDPGDMILFAERTYHSPHAHHGTETRLSCAAGFRPGRKPLPHAWPRPEKTQRWVASMPAEVQPLLEHYTGIVRDWRDEGK
jgi:ectoine hydroxylase-related dioxygenase (phytanoyl-CoA dioxygenase family)